MKLETIIEQIALLFASFVWTSVVLSMLILFWVYQDVQNRWDTILNPPPAVAQVQQDSSTAPIPPTPLPTVTPWAGPGPTLTPTPTLYPTPLPTRVVAPPSILPETYNADEPTPIPVAPEENVNPSEGEAATEDNQEQPEVPAVPQSPFATAMPTSTLSPEQIAASQTAAAAPAAPAPAAAPAGGTIPSRLVIESVGIDSKVVPVGWQMVEQNGQQYSIWDVANYAVGWHKTTASLGQAGNSVFAGHHNVNGEVFRDLVNVEVGDAVVLYAGGKQFTYEVELKTIVKEKGEPVEVRQRNAQWIAPTDDERLTFVTCWPYTNNTHRVIVVAKPI